MSRNSGRGRWYGEQSLDWSLLELSIFKGAARSLELQGVRVEVERGMTDEGDPWLVFCDADTSNLLCHCARLDGGKYVACVPFKNIGSAGSALTDVLGDFFSISHWAKCFLSPSAIHTEKSDRRLGRR